ncbi:MAG: glycoside hydrolase family 2 TIM barrel-domain containing protein [Bacteroidales bacterium]
MRKYLIIFFTAGSLLVLFLHGCWRGDVTPEFREAVTARGRTEILFDAGWRFHRGDTAAAETENFNDSLWRQIDLPHDWSIEDIPGNDSPFDSTAIGGIDEGYLEGGIAWYRKEFLLPANLKNKHIQIRFDGVYMNSDVWLNGQLLGNHPYGYTSFRYDITQYLRPGKVNVIAVKVRNEGRNSRWYSGSGIYRHVWLSVASPVHLDPWKIAVTTPDPDSAHAVVKVNSVLINDSKREAHVVTVTTIYDPAGKETISIESKNKIEPEGEITSFNVFNLKKPLLWSPGKPALYTAANELFVEDKYGRRVLVDRIETSFGVRGIKVSADSGFMLNGKRVLLKGGCMHHDNGPLGAAAYDRAEERRVELMKASGFNAIRCSHNPPSPAFLDACDRLGMMVIDEAFDMWSEAKNPDDYHLWFNDWGKKDIESMVLRDRNHPSVIFWSIGNEIPESGKPEGAKLASELAGMVKELDPSRLVTSAVNSVGPDKDQFFSALDICGYNYEKERYVSDHNRLPGRVMFGSESFALEAYDYWMAVSDHPWVIGDFVWTGFDYLGEASIGWLGYPHEGSFYPWTNAFCGDIDICGFKRPQSFYRDVLWNDNKTVSLFVRPPVPSFAINPKKEKWSKWEWQDVVASWNWIGYDGKTINVEAYSSCQEAELFLNGRSLGRKRTDRQTKWIARWNVRYEPGLLEVKGYENRIVVASSEIRTAGEPVKIKMEADRSSLKANGQDLSYITIEIADKDGIRNPVARNLVRFSIEGPGTIISVGSSDPMSTESFKKPYRKAYQGRCIVIVKSERSQGEIRLKAMSEGLQGAEVIIGSS